VYALAHFLNQQAPLIPQNTLTKPPSAELAPGQVDQDTLPDYETLDTLLKAFIEDRIPIQNIIQHGIDAKTAYWVFNAVSHNDYKRNQSAPILKVSGKAFGPGRKIPLAKHL
jgi:NH3-dependent NAD+ synthetase